MRIVLVLICLVILAGLGGCTAEKSGQGAAPATQKVQSGQVKWVSLKASSYNPETLYITKGTTVTWINEEEHITRRVVHMPTEATGRILFESGALQPGQSYSYTFNEPGRYSYADPQHGGGRSPFIEVS